MVIRIVVVVGVVVVEGLVVLELVVLKFIFTHNVLGKAEMELNHDRLRKFFLKSIR